MDIVIAFAGPVSALLGVLLGVAMTARAQERVRRDDRTRSAQDVRRIAFVNYLAAVRAYVTYVMSHPSDITVRHEIVGTDARLVFDAHGYAFREALETSYTELQLVAQDQKTVDHAHLVARAARRIAVAAATRDDHLRSKTLVFWESERQLVNQLRSELGQELALSSPYDRHAVLP